ncbi:MAG: PKD domain-containing protein [Bacteroidota bacterium]|nr:PKD domain-containing protein [Bacteroidota bacterium]
MIKTFTKNFKKLFFGILIFGLHQTSIAQCTANFVVTYNANGNVQFLSTSTPTPGSGHFWNFGNSQTSSLQNPNITYTANGVYTVCLSIWTPTAAPTCSASICQTVNITTAPNPTCLLNASFTQITSANSATFLSNSTGTVIGSTYTWDYGDMNFGFGNSTTHTYASPGFYNCKLVVNNGSGCIDSVTNSVFVNGPCNLIANFTANQLGNGNVQFISTSTNTLATTTYVWYKNSTYAGSTDPITINFINGTYTVTLYASNNSSFCASTSSQVITVTSNTCNLVASFVSTVAANSASFLSTSSGTIVGSTYTWYYGDATQGSGSSSAHNYGGPGFFLCSFVVSNGSGCSDSTSSAIVTTGPCNLNASFVANQLGNGNVQFVSTSTGTTAVTTYDWYKNAAFMGSGDPINMNFPNGTYTITLAALINASTACSSTVSQVVAVTSNTCNVSASFSYTQSTGGLVNFASTSTGTIAGMTYAWDFGDGFNTIGGPLASHTYSNAGIHNVLLVVQDPNNPICKDSVAVPVNINSVPCVANSNFTMTMITSGWWNAIPSYPWNVVSATWNWGDNTSDNQLYTSHTYSPIGVYNVCLTVSVSCGATSTTCVTYTITSPPDPTGSGDHHKASSPISMAYINVIPPQNITLSGIKQQTIINESNLLVYPNPSNGKFEIKLIGLNETEARIKVYNVAGGLVYEAKGNIQNGHLNHQVKLDNAQGIYLLKIESGSGVIIKKIILKD